MSTELKIETLEPYEIKKVYFKRVKFKEPPVVIITSYGNYKVVLLEVNEKYFKIENSHDNKVKFNYLTLEKSTVSNNTIQGPTPYLNVLNKNIDVESNNYIVNIDLMQLVDYEEFYNIRFAFNPEQSMMFIDENNNITINTEMFFLIDPSDIAINVVATLESSTEISKNILINIHLLQEIYQTINNFDLKYNSDSDLTQYAGYDLTYITDNNETQSAFILPNVTQTKNTFMKITTDFSASPNFNLFILNDQIPVYFTDNPNNPETDRIALNNNYNIYTNYDYATLLLDQKTYYFWTEENNQLWYVSTVSFPKS